MLERAAKAFKRAIHRRPAQVADDDFDWRTYSRTYERELQDLEQGYLTRLVAGDYEFDGQSLRVRGAARPLHPNHRLLYESVLILNPGRVLEVGCGGGDHLHNLSLLAPQLDLFGGDRSEEQLSLLRQRNPGVLTGLSTLDITAPFSDEWPEVDVAYTQAVLMHIQTGTGHLVGLANLFRCAKRHLVLMENWQKHTFVADIKRLHADGLIDWPDVHLYFRRSPELAGRPHLLVASSAPLAFEELVSDSVLIDAMAP